MIKYIHPREAVQMILSLPKMFGWSSALEETHSREFFYHSTPTPKIFDVEVFSSKFHAKVVDIINRKETCRCLGK